MANAKAVAERLLAWLRGHPACGWPVASTVVMGLHGVTEAECSPKSATKVWAAMVRRVRKWCAAVEPFRTEVVQFSAVVIVPSQVVGILPLPRRRPLGSGTTALVDIALGPGAHHADVEEPRVAVLKYPVFVLFCCTRWALLHLIPVTQRHHHSRIVEGTRSR